MIGIRYASRQCWAELAEKLELHTFYTPSFREQNELISDDGGSYSVKCKMPMKTPSSSSRSHKQELLDLTHPATIGWHEHWLRKEWAALLVVWSEDGMYDVYANSNEYMDRNNIYHHHERGVAIATALLQAWEDRLERARDFIPKEDGYYLVVTAPPEEETVAVKLEGGEVFFPGIESPIKAEIFEGRWMQKIIP